MAFKYCPRCHKPAYRIVTIPPDPILDIEGIYEMSDDEIETLSKQETMMKVLAAPSWNVALVCSAQSSNISFTCPWCRKGKIVILKERKEEKHE